MITWACHICIRKRPDDKISVLTKPVMIDGQKVGDQNIRYCNDNPACIEGAKTFSFLGDDKNTEVRKHEQDDQGRRPGLQRARGAPGEARDV